MDGKLNGIIIDGKVYVPTKSKTDNCKYCHLKPQETGVFHCIISNWCYDLGKMITTERYTSPIPPAPPASTAPFSASAIMPLMAQHSA